MVTAEVTGQDHPFWAALHGAQGLTQKAFRLLIKEFGSARQTWEAPGDAIQKTGILNNEKLRLFLSYRGTCQPEREMEKLEKLGIAIITIHDPQYPEALKCLYDPPPALLVKGEILERDSISIAVVGCRKATHYGKQAAERLARELANAGFTVVSGMARGIDTTAHQATLAAGGRTLAVLGSGLDRAYPPENRKLMEEIASHGAVVSEFPLGTPPDPWNFPQRNRIISGLSLGTLVVEAGQRSGALITAAFALEQGKGVFAVPGPITSDRSLGPHSLIRDGARLVESVEDIIEEMRPEVQSSLTLQALRRGERGAQLTLESLSREEEKILSLVKERLRPLEEIVEETGFSSHEVLSHLLFLEMKGLAKRLPGNLYGT